MVETFRPFRSALSLSLSILNALLATLTYAVTLGTVRGHSSIRAKRA